MKNKIYFSCLSCFFLLGAFGCEVSAKLNAHWRQQCVVQDVRLNELSGLSESLRYPGYFWANNDSGDSLRCFLISPKGETVAVVNLKEYGNVDTESLRVAGTREKSWVYISDTGDNRAQRPQVEIDRFPEPEIDVRKLHQEVSLSCEQMVLKYGDGTSSDAETLLIDKNQRVGIVTKSLLGSKLWITPQPFSPAPQTLQSAGPVPIDKWRKRDEKYSLLITDGQWSNDGKRLALMTYTHLFIWNVPDDTDFKSLAKIFLNPPDIQESLPPLKQAESLSFVGDDSHVAVSSEGVNPPIMEVDFAPH